MLKVMGLIQRRGDLPLDSFRLHWRTIHRGLALRLADAGLLAGYVQNHRLDIPVPGLRIIADGVPETWFADSNLFETMRGHDAYRGGVFHDEPKFMVTEAYRSLRLEEERGTGAERRDCAGLLKAILLLDADDPGLEGDAVRTAAQRLLAPAERGQWVQTSWWPDAAAFDAAWARRGRGADGLLAEERVVFWPGDVPPPADWRPVAPTRD